MAGRGAIVQKKPVTQKPTQGQDPAVAQTDKDIALGQNYGQGLADKFYTQDDLNKVMLPSGPSALDNQITQKYADAMGTAGNRSPEMSNYLSTLLGIGQNGWTAPQFQSIYEQTLGTQNTDNQSAQRNLAATLANNGVRGGAAGAANANLLAQQAINRRALQQNVYSQGVQNQTNALSQYGTALSGQEGAEFNRGTTARNDWATQAQAGQTNALNNQKYNNDQYNAWRAGQMGTYTGGTGAYLSQLGSNRANAVNQRGVNFAMQHYQA